MCKSERLKKLITSTSAIVGGNSALAKRLNCPPSSVSMWLSGVRACPVWAILEMCVIAQVDPISTVGCILIETDAPEKQMEVDRLSKKLLALGGASDGSTMYIM